MVGAVVFPTLVGVFPLYLPTLKLAGSLPHARGGVSRWQHDTQTIYKSSPRSWGCFRQHEFTCVFYVVFPTLVGVFLE